MYDSRVQQPHQQEAILRTQACNVVQAMAANENAVPLVKRTHDGILGGSMEVDRDHPPMETGVPEAKTVHIRKDVVKASNDDIGT